MPGLLLPKRQKFRRQMRRQAKGLSYRGSQISFGESALRAKGSGVLTSRQIEAARKSVSHFTKRGGKLWIRIFPDKPITRKPIGVRMGSGKGPVDHYAAVISEWKILFELSGLAPDIMTTALTRAARKLPIQTKVVFRENIL